MTNHSNPIRNWFTQGGQAYARFRPQYPGQLAAYLASIAPNTQTAVDVGCGTGQFTRLLAQHFDSVVGLDPSADQIANAATSHNISYRQATAEKLGLPNGCASVITVAQAAHWFDLPLFYAEVRRVGTADTILALISYGVLKLDPELDGRFQVFYREEIGPHWPAQRQLVDAGYATIDFPFCEITAPMLEIRHEWDLSQFMGYVSTWSAVRHAQEAGKVRIVQAFADDLAAIWGNEHTTRPITWPINMRVGKL